MKGFIVSASHESDSDSTQVRLFGKLENGQSFMAIKNIIPYFFITQPDAKKSAHLLTKYTVENVNIKNFAGEVVARISHKSQTELNKISSLLHEKKIDTYEADIKPHTRFMIDNDILGSISLEGEYLTGERVDRFYQDPDIKKADFTPNLKILSIDIESDKNLGSLFCVGLYSKEYKKVFIVSEKKLENAISCKSEEECLEKVKQQIIKLDPDVITGWNIADFDFPYLKSLYEKHEITFDIGRDNSKTKTRVSSDFFKDSTVTIAGRQVMDGVNLIQDPFIQEAPSIKNVNFESWTLEDVSQALLKEGKLLKGKSRHEQIETLYKKDPQKIVDYNLQDCKLAFDILEKTKTIELAIERCQLTGMTLDKITASIVAFDSLYIREARKQSIVSPTTRFTKKEERIKGGYVMDSKPGIYHNILVLDFKSLYPSIIKTFNIDPASFLGVNKVADAVIAPNGAAFTNTNGILPQIITKLHEAREKAKREKHELASYAIKIIMNSFFGVLANPNCRYFSLDMANAITHFGQYIIKLTAEKMQEKGYNVIYSDTDAVFIEAKAEGSQAKKVGEEMQDHINNFYKSFVKEHYKRTSLLELEFKRHYIAFMLPKLRGGEKGSKKRYAGLLENNGKEELEIVGLEAIRGDWTEAAQDFQRELLMHIFKRQEFIAFIKKYVKDIRAGKLDSKLVYKKSIRKSLDEYTKTTPPHVKAARQLEKLDSNIIEYYITEEGPEPVQKLKHKLDYDHYIDKQIAPIADTILFFFNKTFEDISKESKQAKLFA